MRSNWWKLFGVLVSWCVFSCSVEDNIAPLMEEAGYIDLSKEPKNVRELLETGLSLLRIETIDQVEPTCDTILPPVGSIGRGITNTVKVPAMSGTCPMPLLWDVLTWL